MSKMQPLAKTVLFLVLWFFITAILYGLFNSLGVEIYEAYFVPFWIILILLFCKFEKIPLEQVRLRIIWKNNFKYILFPLILGFALIFLIVFALYMLNYASFTFSEEINPLFIVWIAIAYVIGAFGEEAVFRGYILSKLEKSYDKTFALIVSSLLFSSIHIFNIGFTAIAGAQLFIGGLALAILTLTFNSILPPTIFHWAWNFSLAIFGFPVSGEHKTLILKATISGPPLITGGKFGPEGGIVGLMSISLGLLIIIKTYKQLKSHV